VCVYIHCNLQTIFTGRITKLYQLELSKKRQKYTLKIFSYFNQKCFQEGYLIHSVEKVKGNEL